MLLFNAMLYNLQFVHRWRYNETPPWIRLCFHRHLILHDDGWSTYSQTDLKPGPLSSESKGGFLCKLMCSFLQCPCMSADRAPINQSNHWKLGERLCSKSQWDHKRTASKCTCAPHVRSAIYGSWEKSHKTHAYRQITSKQSKGLFNQTPQPLLNSQKSLCLLLLSDVSLPKREKRVEKKMQ